MTSPASSEAPRQPPVPAATRARRPGWRDPRIVAGVLIVALSVLGGARLLAGADDTVPVWAARHDLPVGTTVSAADLVQQRVRFADGSAADHYVSAETGPPDDATLTRPVASGELLPRAALGGASASAVVEVPLSVAPDDLPATVRRGAIVDVYVALDTTAGKVSTTRLVLDDVVVLAVPARGDSLAPQATQQVIVGVPLGDPGLAKQIGELTSGRLVLTRQG